MDSIEINTKAWSASVRKLPAAFRALLIELIIQEATGRDRMNEDALMSRFRLMETELIGALEALKQRGLLDWDNDFDVALSAKAKKMFRCPAPSVP